MSARRATVVLTSRAQADLEDIVEYSQRHWDEAQATTYAEAIRAGLRRLAEFPELGRARDDLRPGRRSLRVRQHIVIYRIDGDRVVVLRILHGRMDLARHVIDGDDELP